MRKTKFISVLLLGSVFGLSSCTLPDFMAKIPGLSKLASQQKEEKEEEQTNNQQQGGQQSGGEQGGSQQGGGSQGGGEQGGGSQGGGQQSTEEAAAVVIDFSEFTATEGTFGETSFSTALGSNTNKAAPAYNADKSELRLYIGNTLSITSTKLITSVVFDANNCGESKADGKLVANVGTLTSFSWTGSTNSVTFTVDSGRQVHIAEIDINGGGEGGGTTQLLTEFPLASVQSALEGGTDESFPIPNGTGFKYELDTEYYYSCYVTIYGGSYTEYLGQLETAGFTIDDSDLDTDGLYYAFKAGGTLEISLEVTGDDEYVLNYYAVEPTLDEFPKDAVDTYLAGKGINVAYPIPDGTSFVGGLDETFDSYDVKVVGGSSTSYMTALESETYGFTKDDSYYSSVGCYAFIKGDLEIDVYPWDVDADASYYLVSFMEAE